MWVTLNVPYHQTLRFRNILQVVSSRSSLKTNSFRIHLPHTRHTYRFKSWNPQTAQGQPTGKLETPLHIIPRNTKPHVKHHKVWNMYERLGCGKRKPTMSIKLQSQHQCVVSLYNLKTTNTNIWLHRPIFLNRCEDVCNCIQYRPNPTSSERNIFPITQILVPLYTSPW